MTRLLLPQDAGAQIAREARAAFPRECCGLIEGVRDGDVVRAEALHRTANLSAEPERFEIDAADHIRALRAARTNGRAIVGCYHSHPDGRAEPSACDQEGATEHGFLWLIAGIEPAGAVSLAAFVFKTSHFERIEIV